MRTCKNSECGKRFEAGTHNQVYCSSECCRVATNTRIKRKYHENKARLSGRERYCECGVKLSRYNASDECSACEVRSNEKITRDVEVFFRGVRVVKETPGFSMHGD